MTGGGTGLPDPPPGIAAPLDDPGRSGDPDRRGEAGAAAGGGLAGGWPPHDVPSAAELLDAVRHFLESEIVAATEGRVRFHARVAANVAGMVAREIVLGPGHAEAHAARLATLGVGSESELAAAIRSGALDGRAAEVRAVVRASVADKLAVANPSYRRPETADADTAAPPAPHER